MQFVELYLRKGLGLGSGLWLRLGLLTHLANQHYSAVSVPQIT